MTKISALPSDTAPTITDSIPTYDAETNTTKRVLLSDLQKIMTPVGTVQSFAGSSSPASWLICDGSAVSRTTYAALFAVIGTTYGAGDGSTTFNIPDMRGRVAAGVDSTGLRLGTSGLGATAVLGATGGAQTHWHWQTVGSDGGAIYAENAGVGSGRTRVISIDRASVSTGHSVTGSREDGTYDGSTIAPTLVLNFIIKT